MLLSTTEVEAPLQQDRSPMPSATRPKRTRATPGTMRLRALREQGRVVDFVWQSVSPAAGKLLRCQPVDLIARALSETVSGGPLGHPALIDRYRRVLEYGNAQSFAQVHLIDGRQDVVVHRVVRHGDGVAVTLTNLSADRRKQAWRLEHGQPERELQQRTTQ
ncbi:MAG: PAS domain-containing protein [Pseudomonadota bacterium]